MRKWLGRLTENWVYKLCALVLAIAIRAAVVEDMNLTRSIGIPIQLRNLPRELEQTTELPERLLVEVRGSSRTLTEGALGEAAAVLDLRSVSKPGVRTFPITAEMLHLPPGVSMERAMPSQVRLHFENRLRRKVPVRVRISSPPPEGYELVSEIIEPNEVTIAGPASAVSKLDGVEGDPIDLSAVVSRQEFTVQVFVPHPRVRLEESGRVTVKVEVRKSPKRRN